MSEIANKVNPSIKVIGDYTIYLKKILGDYYLIQVLVNLAKYMKRSIIQRNNWQLLKYARILQDQTPKQLRRSLKEIKVMQSLNSQNLLRFYDYNITQNNIYMFIEYCNGGTLTHYIKTNFNLSDRFVVEFIQQMCNGFKNLYENNIIHRDLKPDNILIHDDVFKISDFGFAKFLEDPDKVQDHTLRGTPLYVPPQVFDEKKFSTKFDVWSLGVITYEIMFNKPFHDSVTNMGQLVQRFNQLRNSQIQFPDSNRSPLILALIRKMLQYKEDDRISWPQLFEHDVCRLSADEFLGKISDPKSSLSDCTSVQQIYFQKLQALEHFTSLLQDINGNSNQYFALKWSCIVLTMQKFHLNTLLSQVTLKQVLNNQEVQQREFYKLDISKQLVTYINHLIAELSLSLTLSLELLNHQTIETFEMQKGHRIPDDVYIYHSLKKEEFKQIYQVLKKSIDQVNVNRKLMQHIVDDLSEDMKLLP